MASLFLRIEVKTTLVPPVAHGTHFKIRKNRLLWLQIAPCVFNVRY